MALTCSNHLHIMGPKSKMYNCNKSSTNHPCSLSQNFNTRTNKLIFFRRLQVLYKTCGMFQGGPVSAKHIPAHPAPIMQFRDNCAIPDLVCHIEATPVARSSANPHAKPSVFWASEPNVQRLGPSAYDKLLAVAGWGLHFLSN